MSRSLLKSLLPRSLFSRALLMLVLPVILAQFSFMALFYWRHWVPLREHATETLAREVTLLVKSINRSPAPHQRRQIIESARDVLALRLAFLPGAVFDDLSAPARDHPLLGQQMELLLPFPFQIVQQEEQLLILVQITDGLLLIDVPKAKLASPVTLWFLLWVIGIGTGLLVIAILFLRNQIRPIRDLAQAAAQFSRGETAEHFQPRGAREIRHAGQTFLIMRDRLQRLLHQRMTMLAGISHDLRTPLARMKLELALLTDKDAARELSRDVQDMEHMIAEYLDYARGEGREEPETVDLTAFCDEVLADYRKGEQTILFHAPRPCPALLRPRAFRRALRNLLDNACRYGSEIQVTVKSRDGHRIVMVDDNGPGIPEEKREDAFQPFTRLDSSRNSDRGGVGLGLAIVRDIVTGHGGMVTLDSSPSGGLRVCCWLPLATDGDTNSK